MQQQDIEQAVSLLSQTVEEVEKRIVGQRDLIEGLLMGIVVGGHVLLEGVPGLAKTLVIRTLAEVMDGSFRRIQFTPDLLPADLTGTMVYRPTTGEFVARKGPVFSNIILADEINRAPAKVQSALLEAMQERQVTLGDQTHQLEAPFFVLATQNPIEQEGTYPLPEAQLDRFLVKLVVTYPSFEEEVRIIRRVGTERPIPVSRVLNRDSLASIQRLVEEIRVDERIEEYIVRLVTASRPGTDERAEFARYIEYGASPRATIYTYRLARVRALLDSRDYVIPEDIKAVAPAVFRHRIILTYEATSEGLSTDDIVQEVLGWVDVP
jgi:MoxR-like ATPase